MEIMTRVMIDVERREKVIYRLIGSACTTYVSVVLRVRPSLARGRRADLLAAHSEWSGRVFVTGGERRHLRALGANNQESFDTSRGYI